MLIVLIGGVALGKFLFTTTGDNSKSDDYIIEGGVGSRPQSASVSSEPPATAPSPIPTHTEKEKVGRRENYPEREKTTLPYGSRSGKEEPAARRQNEKQPVPEKESRTYYTQPSSPSPTQREEREKLKAGEKIDLNSADSLQLCKIPGIGPTFSRRIVSYRNLLGGYHRKEQLQEIYGMYVELYEKITPFLDVKGDSLRKIPVNSASVEQLKRHPYLNFYQAKAIVEIRKKRGNLKSINELILLEEFSEEDWKRIGPYLQF